MSAVYYEQSKDKKDKRKTVRYFNWKLAIVIVISFFVLVVGVFALHQWRKSNRSQQGLVRGSKAYDEGHWEEAGEYLGYYLAVRPNDVSVLLKYADAQLKIRPIKRNHMQQAIQAYRTILRIDKDNAEAVSKLIDIYLRIGPGEAELIARRQLETNPDPMLERLLAQSLIAQRKFPEAVSLLTNVIQEHPDQVLAYESLGRLVEQRPNDFPDVPPIHWFDRAVENNPSSALAYLIRAAFYRRNGDVPRALADLDQAQGQDLSEADVRLRLAEESIYCGDLERAESHLEAVSKVIPKNPGLWQIWAQYALRTQSKETMLKVAKDGLEALSSQPWDFMPVAAKLYIQCDQLDDANACIAQLSQKGIAPADVAFLRGSVAVRQGRVREAVRRWQQSIESGNESPQVRLALASALSQLGDSESAERQLRILISESPDWSEARLALARLMARSGNWIETAEHARRASELRPGDPGPVLLYLEAQIQLLKRSSAGPGAGYQEMVKAVETQLSALKKGLGDSDEVQLLEFEFALLQGRFEDARMLLDQLKQTSMSPEKIILNEVGLLTAQDKIDQAIRRLEDALRDDPKSVNLIRSLAILSDKQGLRKKCEETLKRGLTSIEEPFSQRQLALLLARFYSQWNQEEDAYTLILTLSQKLTDDIPIKRRLLSFERVLNNTEQAQKLVDEIKALEGENGWQWRYEQAKLWFAGGHFENHHPEIVSLLHENMLANPNDQASRVLLGRTHERAGDLQLAVSTYREALRMAPNDLRVIVPMLAALYKAKEYDEAEKIMIRASRLKLSHPDLTKWTFMDCVRRGELDSASVILQDYVNSDPNNQAACLSLALLKIQQGKLDEASKLLDEQKRRDPNSILVTAAQIQVSLRRKNADEAIRLSDEMVHKLNDTSAYMLRARTFEALRQTDRAIEDLQRAVEMDPNNTQVWMTKSDLYRSQGRMDKAIADIQKALSLDPDNVYIQKRAISLYFVSGEPDEIREGEILLEKALASNIDDVELRLFKARALLAKGTESAINEADRILDRIAEDQPEVGETWVLKGEIAIRRGEPGRAIDAALSGLTYQSDDRALLLLKARAEAMRSPVLAVPTLKGLYEMDPNDSGVAVFLANTYIEAGESEKAVALLRRQLDRCDDSNRRQCQIALAVALYKNGNTNRALKDLDSLLEAVPNDPNPLLAKAKLLREDRLWSELDQEVIHWYETHPDGSRILVAVAADLTANNDNQAKSTAEKILNVVRKEDPNCVEAMNVLAVLLLQTPGRADESAELYRRILELEPNNVIAMNNLAWILSEEQDKPEAALEFARKGLRINPDYNDLLDTRGVIYYRLGEYDKAVEDFSRAIQLYSSTAQQGVSTRFHLGRAYAKLEQASEAVEHLELSLDLNSRIGGLTQADVDEARRLLKQLQEGR
ncbi:MAG: tetratricopeptide repeat protein [Sedimentisphaerales bacterium]|nr:tetratricopeptide repeat protein [Sedimentisphaerales bacterium]